MMADYNHDADSQREDQYMTNFFQSNPNLGREELNASLADYHSNIGSSFSHDEMLTDEEDLDDEEDFDEEEEEGVHLSFPVYPETLDIPMLGFNFGQGLVFVFDWSASLELLRGLLHLGVFNNEEVDGRLSEETISKHLRTRACNDDDMVGSDEICVVCQDQLCQENETIATLECGHEYHVDCVKGWLLKENTCPLCRAKAIDPDTEMMS